MWCYKWAWIGAFLALSGCSTEPDFSYAISPAPTSEATMTEALRAVSICSNSAPNGAAAISLLRRAGYTPKTRQSIEATKANLEAGQLLELLEMSAQGVIVLVRTNSPFEHSFLCSVAVREMTLEQGRSLAQTWIGKYQATDDTAFRGLRLEDDVLDLRALTPDYKVQIGLTRRSSHLDGRGAVVSLLLIGR